MIGKVKISGRKLLVHLSIVLYMVNIFGKYFLPGAITKLLPIMAVVLIVLINGKYGFAISKSKTPYYIFGLIFLLGSVYSNSLMKGFMYAMSYFLACIFVELLTREKIQWAQIMHFNAVGCGALAFFVIVQSILPAFISRITAKFSYTAYDYYAISSGMRNGWYFGLFNDRAPAAFFGTMLCGCGLYYILGGVSKRKTRTLLGVVCYMIGCWSVLLTAKRGLLFSMLIASFLCYILNRKVSGKSIFKICIAVLAIVIIGGIVLLNSSAAEVMLSRIFNNEDFFTNRLDIYSAVFQNIMDNLILGTGTGSAYELLGVGGHNIYLTVAMENGILGLVLFVFAIGNELVRTIKNILSLEKEERFHNAILTMALFIQIVFVIYGMSGNPLYDNYVLFYYFIGVLINENVRYKRENIRYTEGVYSYIS